ncbi:hypothetical protein ABMB68_008635 [Bradyrhizobium sp. RT4a]
MIAPLSYTPPHACIVVTLVAIGIGFAFDDCGYTRRRPTQK